MKAMPILFALFMLIVGSTQSLAVSLDELTGAKPEFLPVEEAYRASITIGAEELELDWILEPGYYLYKDQFKFSANYNGESVPLEATFSESVKRYDEYFEKELDVFYNTAHVDIPITELPSRFELKVTSQGCADAGLCYAPRTQYFQIDRLQGLATPAETSTRNQSAAGSGIASGAAEEESQHSFWLYLVMAVIGGIILNLMPCVFPILSLKALGLAASAGSKHHHHMHGWAYTIGVIGSFLVAALIIIAAKTAGEQSGWGFQLQSPAFVASLVYLFLVMGLSLSGMIYFGTSLMGVGQGLTTQDGLRGSFFTGVLAAVVASPCTGPMMAPALGFALTQPTPLALAIFVALGFGMALPFLLLSYSPKLASLLPRPGIWMEKMKEVLAFPMYLTAAWLLFVFGRQVGMYGVFFLLLGAIAIVFSIWLLQNLPQNRNWRAFVKGCAFVALVFAGYIAATGDNFRSSKNEGLWQPYSAALVEQLREGGQPVLVDLTADWCITCKTNEALALSRQGFLDAVAEHNVALVRGDWTYEDPEIGKLLEQFGRSGVPMYLMYPANTTLAPELLPQLLTQTMVVEAIERASTGG